MRRTLAYAVLTAAMFSVSPALAEGNSLFAGGPRYDGTVKITKLSGSSCPNAAVQLLKGRTGEAVYRAKVKPTQLAEAMSIQLPLAGALLLVAGGDGYFKGANKPLSGSFIMDAFINKLPTKSPKNSVANLTFMPATIVEGTESFTFTGKITNYAFASCQAEVRGSFYLRGVP